MLNKKTLDFIGLCSRAGKCLFGEDACLSGIRSGKVYLLLLDANASENTTKRFASACAFHDVPLLTFDAQSDAAYAAGKAGRKVIAVADKGFARKMIDMQKIAE